MNFYNINSLSSYMAVSYRLLVEESRHGAYHVLLHWTFNVSEHRLGPNGSGMTDHHSSAHGQAQYSKMSPGVVLVTAVP